MLKRALAGVPALLLLPLVATAACGDKEPAAACDYPTSGGPAAKEVARPPADPTVSGTVPVVLHTTVGDLHLQLDAEHTPCTVGSFVSLAKQGYYDGSHCHRLGDAPGFQMLQCGDPTATGSGGPGYTIPDELDGVPGPTSQQPDAQGNVVYPAGTLAMANTGQPDSGGGQFFMVFGPTQLPPAYTVFGTFDAAAIKTLEGVAKKGVTVTSDDGTGEPKEKVEFRSVSVG